MKYEITHKGAHRDGKAFVVGDVIQIDGDIVPESLVGKGRVLREFAQGEKTVIVNPQYDRDDLKKQADELGIQYPANIPSAKLSELIDAELAK